MARRPMKPYECVDHHGKLLLKLYNNIIIKDVSGFGYNRELPYGMNKEFFLERLEEFIELAVDMSHCECCDND